MMKIYKEKNRSVFEKISLIDKETFVIGDTHFFHKNIVQYEPERAKFWEEGFTNQEDWIKEKWNKTVKNSDLVLHLGDFLFKNAVNLSISEELKGKKFLIIGNHDKKDNSDLYNPYFEFVIGKGTVFIQDKKGVFFIKTDHKLANGLIKEIEGVKVLFSHYPVYPGEKWDTYMTKTLRSIFEHFQCDLNIHGHTHSKSLDSKKLYNASIENIDFKPKKIKDILKERGF